ncbi:MAG: hypothetical protein IJ407_05735 [Clostridia bacterium]|nr:hypothetical protein [Clostridia bacterium]
MENFIEYCLPYRLTALDRIKQYGYTIGLLALGAVLIALVGPVGILLCAGACYLAYRVYFSFLYELEYTLLENEITFTKIINKERRREMLKADISKTESYGPIDKMPANVKNVRSFVSHQGEEPEYFWITQKKNGESVCILFQPNERVLAVFATRARGKLR